MRKREFTNRMSLQGAYLYAMWQSQQNKIVGRDPHVGFSILLRMTIRMISRDPHVSPLDFLRMTILKIGRSLEFFALQKIGVTLLAVILGHILFLQVILGQQRVTRVSRIIKWILGSSPRMTGERKCPMMTMLMGILISSMSMTGTANAECVPYPDCASIGYAETSCETQAVKCPFDGTKLYCLPCDSKYQHSCNGVGETGEGAGCKGKYETCGCQSGYNYFCGINFCKLNYC